MEKNRRTNLVNDLRKNVKQFEQNLQEEFNVQK
jgi:hypothetical protein